MWQGFFPNSYATTGNQTHISSVAPSLRVLNPGIQGTLPTEPYRRTWKEGHCTNPFLWHHVRLITAIPQNLYDLFGGRENWRIYLLPTFLWAVYLNTLQCFSFSNDLDSLINSGKAFECPRQRAEALWQPPSTDDFKGAIDESISFEFEDPKTYKGPVVPGWEPGKTS